jgi:Spy/CpxP family protein refolding chaperone
MMRNRILIIAAPLLVAISTVAGAQDGPRRGPPPGGMGGRGGPGGRCAQTADSLTDTQKAQVRTLAQAFNSDHAAQLDSLRAVGDAARAAREGGKTLDEVRAIMALGRPINEALAPARKQFSETVVTLLTPAQLAAGCIPPAPGGPPPGGRRGGGPPPIPPVG